MPRHSNRLLLGLDVRARVVQTSRGEWAKIKTRVAVAD